MAIQIHIVGAPARGTETGALQQNTQKSSILCALYTWNVWLDFGIQQDCKSGRKQEGYRTVLGLSHTILTF